MTFPDPKPGLVIRYAYLWTHEADLGMEEGSKDRPCCVLFTVLNEDGGTRVAALPITHRPPSDPDLALELPAKTKRRLGLDDDQSWIVLSEANVFTWPGPDLRMLRGQGPESVALGYLPASLINTMRDRVLALIEKNRSRLVQRTE